ncbi:hypothetical protein D3C86_1885080 [compost metagenome]
MAVRNYNTYDMYGLLQGLLDALDKHANAIPLQVRVDLATAFIRALPEYADDIQSEPAQRKPIQQRRVYREPNPVAPELSPLGAFIAH